MKQPKEISRLSRAYLLLFLQQLDRVTHAENLNDAQKLGMISRSINSELMWQRDADPKPFAEIANAKKSSV